MSEINKNKTTIDPELCIKISELLPEGSESTDSTRKIKADLEKAMFNYLSSPDNEEVKEKLVFALTKATGKFPEEINKKIDDWKNDYLTAKEKAYQKVAALSKDAAKAVALFALLNFLSYSVASWQA